MKTNLNLTPQQTFESPHQQAMLTKPKPQDYGYPQYIDAYSDPSYGLPLQRPNPPTPEAVAKAKFVDRTYKWKGK